MTIKTLTTAFTILLTFASASAQDLDFVHSYGTSDEGPSNDRIYKEEFVQENNKILLVGKYYEQLNLEIGSSSPDLTAPEIDPNQGFIALYSENFELLHHVSFGQLVTDAVLDTDSTVIVMGRFAGSTDFDPRPDETLNYEGELAGEGYVGRYKLDGTPLWLTFYNSLYGVWMTDVLLKNGNIYGCGYSYGEDFNMTIDSNIVIGNEGGTNSFVVKLDSEGSLDWYNIFDMSESSCSIESMNLLSDKLVTTVLVNDGELNVSMTENEELISFPHDVNSYIGTYDINTLGLLSYITLDVIQDENIGWPDKSATRNEYGLVTAFKGRGNYLLLSSSVESEDIMISTDENLDYLYINCADSEGKIKWNQSFPYSTIVLETLDIRIDQFGYSYLVGYYQGTVYSNGEIIIEENASPLNNGFIMKLDPLGNLVWAHNLPSQQGELEVNSVSVNEEQDILISGYYTGNHDFDFSANTQLVGNFEEENGFLARYTQEPNEAAVFLNVPILHTEIEESGATSLVYVSINREVSEDVVVEATPDEQIDLGNGAGQPVELTFTPDGEKIMSLDVTAFDDLDTEGDHTGTITFSSSGETNFASLEDQTITFDIIDNDPDAVDEQTSDSQISVYPNPANDEITIDYPKNIAAKTIDRVRILDGNGRAVLEIKDHPKDQPVSVKELSRGSYILKVNAGGMEFSSKLIIE